MERYGSENRAEVFRSQLKSRVKGKGETIPQLSIRKLTRQSYPNVSLDVIEALSLDHFIGALSESEIRLRLREVGPKTLAEAEKIAVRFEAHRIADKQRLRLVGKVDQGEQVSFSKTDDRSSTHSDGLEKRLDDLTKNVDLIQKSLQCFMNKPNFQGRDTNHNFRSNGHSNRHVNTNPRNFNQRQNQFRGGNPRQNQYHQNSNMPRTSRYQNNQQGNFNQPSQGSGPRLNLKDPILILLLCVKTGVLKKVILCVSWLKTYLSLFL